MALGVNPCQAFRFVHSSIVAAVLPLGCMPAQLARLREQRRLTRLYCPSPDCSQPIVARQIFQCMTTMASSIQWPSDLNLKINSPRKSYSRQGLAASNRIDAHQTDERIFYCTRCSPINFIKNALLSKNKAFNIPKLLTPRTGKNGLFGSCFSCAAAVNSCHHEANKK
jgi:hypothetical protein